MRITISHNAREVQQAIRQKPRQVMAALDSKMHRGALEVSREAKRNAPKAFSTLANAIHIYHHAQADYSVFAATDYARMVEEGAGPGGMPSDQTLEDWIKVKGITPADPAMDVDDLVFLIGREIHEHGTPAQPYMQPALEAKRDRLAVLIREGVQQGLRAH